MSKSGLVSADIIKMAAKAGAEAALEKLEKERQKQVQGRKDKRLRNTKLLLRNYRMFKKHCTDSIFEASQLDESAIDILDLMWDPGSSADLFVESIKKSALRTKIIMSHINEMLEVFETICLKSPKTEDARRFRVIHAIYIADEEMSAEMIAETENVDPRTIYRDLETASDKIACLIFGVDWLE